MKTVDHDETVPWDFHNAQRGRVLPPIEKAPGKVRITIRLDEDVVDAFLAMADKECLGYQTLINAALRAHIEGKAPKLEETLRKILREELQAAS